MTGTTSLALTRPPGLAALAWPFRVLVLVAPIGLALLFAAWWIQSMLAPDSGMMPFTDANTYLAAGERLNQGHALYALAPGDRPVTPSTATSTAAILSPPPIAVLWRPIAAVPGGFALWVACAWMALLGTCVYLILRIGQVAAVGVAILSPAIGEQLAVANVAAFFPMLLVVAWRSPRAAGPAVAFMSVTKLAPAVMIGWLAGTRQWRAVAWIVACGLGALALTILFAGANSIPEYLAVARDIKPSFLTVSAMTGIPWASYAVLIGGTIAAVLLGGRPSLSFAVAVVAAVFGTPALYGSGLVTLLAVMAPLADRRDVP